MKKSKHPIQASVTPGNDQTLGVKDYTRLIKHLLYRLSIPYEIDITRTARGRECRNYNNTITYLVDGLQGQIERKLGSGEKRKKLAKEMEEICKINQILQKSPEQLDKYKPKLATLIEVGLDDLQRLPSLEIDHLTDKQRKEFKENGIATLLNYIQATIHFDLKKSILQDTEISIGSEYIRLRPYQLAIYFCCRELTASMYTKLNDNIKKMKFSNSSQYQVKLLQLFDELMGNKSSRSIFTIEFDSEAKPNTKKTKSNAITAGKTANPLTDTSENLPLSMQDHTLRITNNEFTRYLMDFAKDKPVLACGMFGDELFLEYLTKHCQDVNATDSAGATFLHKACFEGSEAICQQLINLDCNITATDNQGFTPILVAAVFNRVEIVKLLLATAKQKGIDLNLFTITALVNNEKHTVKAYIYNIAICLDNLEMAKLFLPNTTASHSSMLLNALKNPTLTKALLRENVTIDIEIIFHALRYSTLEITKEICQRYQGNLAIIREFALLDIEHAETTIIEKAWQLYPDIINDFAIDFITAAINTGSYSVMQTILGLGLKFANEIMKDFLLYKALETCSKRTFTLLLDKIGVFSNPGDAVQKAIELNRAGHAMIILDYAATQLSADFMTKLLYQVFSEFPNKHAIHNKLLAYKPDFSLATLLMMNLEDDIIIKLIKIADEKAILAPSFTENNECLTIADLVKKFEFSPDILKELAKKNIIAIDHANPSSIIHNELLIDFNASEVPTADKYWLQTKLLGECKERQLEIYENYILERKKLLECLTKATQRDFQHYPISGLRIQVNKLAQEANRVIEPPQAMPLRFFTKLTTECIYLNTYRYTDFAKNYTLCQIRGRVNQVILCSNLSDTIKNYNESNDLAEFSALLRQEEFLAGLQVKMIKERQYKATLKLDEKTYTLSAPAELKTPRSKARLLLAQLNSNEPGATSIYIPIYYSSTGFHDNRFATGTTFNGGELTFSKESDLLLGISSTSSS